MTYAAIGASNLGVRRWMCGGAVLAALIHGLYVLQEWLPTTAMGPKFPVDIPLFTLALILIWYASLAVACIALPLALLDQGRPLNAKIGMAAMSFFLVGALPWITYTDSLRWAAFWRLSQRSQPLVDAVIRFEEETGAPPQSWSELIPAYLGEVPQTGMRSYPDYKLMVAEDNEWIIRVPIPRSFSTESFEYRSSGFNYGVRRQYEIGDWGYCSFW